MYVCMYIYMYIGTGRGYVLGCILGSPVLVKTTIFGYQALQTLPPSLAGGGAVLLHNVALTQVDLFS